MIKLQVSDGRFEIRSSLFTKDIAARIWYGPSGQSSVWAYYNLDSAIDRKRLSSRITKELRHKK